MSGRWDEFFLEVSSAGISLMQMEFSISSHFTALEAPKSSPFCSAYLPNNIIFEKIATSVIL